MNALVIWLILVVLFYMGYVFGFRRGMRRPGNEWEPEKPEAPPEASPELVADFQAKLAPLLALSGHRSQGGVIMFDGEPPGNTKELSAQIQRVFAGESVSPLLLEGEQDQVRVVLLPKKTVEASVTKPKWWLHGLLLFLTFLTTTWAGALHAGINLLQEPHLFTAGLPYSFGLLLILGAHELGHYFTARQHGIQVTPPYFIPVPFALGTFGAFIRIKSLTPTRRALFDVAVAGPLAGLVFAIPALLIGLHYSSILPRDASVSIAQGGVDIGSSVLLAMLAKLSLGVSVTEGHRLLLHPLAFAGWLGLMITALNLLPIGQLDGGHMAHGLFGGRKAHALSVVGLLGLFLLALFVWPGLMLWAIIVFFIAGTRDTPATDDVTPVNFSRKMVGYFTFLLLLLILAPVPPTLYHDFGLHGPYL